MQIYKNFVHLLIKAPKKHGTLAYSLEDEVIVAYFDGKWVLVGDSSKQYKFDNLRKAESIIQSDLGKLLYE